MDYLRLLKNWLNFGNNEFVLEMECPATLSKSQRFYTPAKLVICTPDVEQIRSGLEKLGEHYSALFLGPHPAVTDILQCSTCKTEIFDIIC